MAKTTVAQTGPGAAPTQPPTKSKNRRANPKNKKNKGLKLVFNREKRIEFVTGFKKRKDERRCYAREQ